MSHPFGLSAVLDACVLYPAPIRDLLLSLANEGLFKPKWTNEIHNEWMRHLLINRPDLRSEQLAATVNAMNEAFPDANVVYYHPLIQGISLPDPGDRHVVAAAIRAKANVIVTFNTKDFPNQVLEKFGIDVRHPDRFLSDALDLAPAKAAEAFHKQVARLKNPPKTAEEVLSMLEAIGLVGTVAKLRKALHP